jgi:hypothetical protein
MPEALRLQCVFFIRIVDISRTGYFYNVIKLRDKSQKDVTLSVVEGRLFAIYNLKKSSAALRLMTTVLNLMTLATPHSSVFFFACLKPCFTFNARLSFCCPPFGYIVDSLINFVCRLVDNYTYAEILVFIHSKPKLIQVFRFCR